MKKVLILILLSLLPHNSLWSQEADTLNLEFREYLAIVKKYHPLVKQANLKIDEGDFKLLKARGAFDPKIEAGLSEKEFKATEYYNIFNSAFKIPTWYGLELNAKFEENSGVYLNPQNTVPEEGLYSAGISLDVTNGLFMSERMSALKQAKIYQNQSRIKRDLMVADILYEASISYFDWYAAFQELKLYEDFVGNAEFRFKSVQTQYKAGDKPAVDTLEARITFDNRKIEYEQAKLDYIKATLNLSNFLWSENNIPLELQDKVFPEKSLTEKMINYQAAKTLLTDEMISENPKIQYLEYDISQNEIEKRLKANRLLPDLNLDYNFLTSEPEEWQRLNQNNYKMQVKLSLPLFLRKERGDLRLAKLELQNSKYELIQANQEIENKLRSLQNEILSYQIQQAEMRRLVGDYFKLLEAERRKFELGDSSLFLVNNRENSFISAQLKLIQITQKYFTAKAELSRLTTNFNFE